MSEWRPLLAGRAAEAAWRAIEDIAAALPCEGSGGGRDERTAAGAGGEGAAGDGAGTVGGGEGGAAGVPEIGFPGVAGGIAGQALFFAYLALHGGAEAHFETAADLLGKATEALASVPMGPGLYSGFSGVAWAAEHLGRRLFAEELATAEEDPQGEIDEALLSYLGQSPWTGDYDLINGLTGLGVYALERLPRPSAAACLRQVIERVDELAVRTPEGVTWFTAPELLPEWQRVIFPRGNYNLGVAHGVPGTIALLAGACAAGVEAERARQLAEGAVNWMLGKRLKPGSGSCFPYSFAPDVPAAKSRLAWCYGDPGIAAALFTASRACGNPGWKREATAIGLDAAARPAAVSGVRDAGLCHGAAGVAHLFNRMHQASGEERLAEAARFWVEHALALRQPGEGVAGFRAMWVEEDSEQWRSDPGFLEGASGIGLALLAAVSPIEPDWDRLLLLSTPPRPPSGG